MTIYTPRVSKSSGFLGSSSCCLLTSSKFFGFVSVNYITEWFKFAFSSLVILIIFFIWSLAIQIFSFVKCKFMLFIHFYICFFFIFVLICSNAIPKTKASLLIYIANISFKTITCISCFYIFLINEMFNFNIIIFIIF
jgi:hypothetical protein